MTNVEEEVDPDKVNVVEAWGYNYKNKAQILLSGFIRNSHSEPDTEASVELE